MKPGFLRAHSRQWLGLALIISLGAAVVALDWMALRHLSDRTLSLTSTAITAVVLLLGPWVIARRGGRTGGSLREPFERTASSVWSRDTFAELRTALLSVPGAGLQSEHDSPQGARATVVRGDGAVDLVLSVSDGVVLRATTTEGRRLAEDALRLLMEAAEKQRAITG